MDGAGSTHGEIRNAQKKFEVRISEEEGSLETYK
jgi:hypothetical protein